MPDAILDSVRVWSQPTAIDVIGDVTVVAGARGVRAMSWGDRRPDAAMSAIPERDEAIARALDAWFSGRSHTVDVDVDLAGVDGFRADVLATLLKEVGWGETVTYGELAAMAGKPGAARAVGTVMAGNPIPFIIPCHRVVAAGGRIGGYGGTASTASHHVQIKRTLLAREGVTLRG